MVKCCAPGCPNAIRLGNSEKFFRFPSEPGRCHKWLRFCGLEDRIKSARDVKETMRVCVDHFQSEDFHLGIRTRLSSDAVPTIHSNGIVVPSGSRALHSKENLNPVCSLGATLSPVSSPQYRLKVLRTYARKAKLFNSNPISPSLKSPVGIVDGRTSVPSSNGFPVRKELFPATDPTAGCSYDEGLEPIVPSSPLPNASLVASLRSRVRHLEMKIIRLQNAGKNATPSIQQILKATESLMPQSMHELFAAQLKISKFSKHGRRWCDMLKDFALSLYYHSPRSYNFVKTVLNLPSVRTLRHYQKKINMSPGIIQPVLCTLKKLADGPMADKSETVCSLIIDEVAIQQLLHYDSTSDLIVGLADDGKTRLPLKANFCLMAIIKGIKKGWKQVIGYWFSHGAMPSSSLQEIVQKCILELKEVGFIVKALICDQGSNNQSLAHKLGVSSLKPNFELDGGKVHFFYDPPHLLKSIRNNLLKYNLMYNGNIVSWAHIRDIYNLNNDPLKLKLIPKLTKAHINPKMFQKMKVKLAVQVLSRSVHTAIHVYVGMNKIPSSAIHTADFVETMDKLFDSFNSTNLGKDKFRFRYAMTSDSVHVSFLSNVLSQLDNWRFVDCRRQPACLQGWKISIQSLLNLFHEMSSEYNIPKLRTRFLSQDAIENTFSIIRQQHGCNTNPSAYQVENGLRHLLISSLSKLSAKSNCEKDYEYVLTKLSSISIPEGNSQESLMVSDVSDFLCQNDLTVDDSSFPDTDTESDNAIYYVAGYICKKFLKGHTCEQCTKALILGERELTEDHQIFTYFKAFDNNFGGLVLPKTEVFVLFKKWEQIFCKMFLSIYHKTNLSKILWHLIYKQEILEGMCNNNEKENLCKLYITMRTNWSVKFLNQCVSENNINYQKRLRVLDC